MNELLQKRVRRLEVTNLALAEEIAENKLALRALYESAILISRRLPPSSTAGSDPIDMLMLPPWHKDAETGNTLPPPMDLNLDLRGLAAYWMHLDGLNEEQHAILRDRQKRHIKMLETLRAREKDRAERLQKPIKALGPEIGG